MNNRHLWLVLPIFLAGAASSPAADHYIRAGASGNGSGNDWTNACTDFTGSCAVASLVRGDRYFVATGSYSGRTFNRAASGTSVITITKATVDNHGTDTGWNSTYGVGPATFTGSLNFLTSYWDFDGRTGGGPGSWQTGFGFKVSVTGVSSGYGIGAPGTNPTSAIVNVFIRHVEIEGNGGDGDGVGTANDGIATFPAGCTNCLYEYMYIHDMGRCIGFLTGSYNTTVRYLYSGRHESTSGQHSEVFSIWANVSNVTIEHSVITHVEGTGGIIAEIDGLFIHGNVFYRPPGSTWELGNGAIGTWTSSTLRNAKVYNNTFINVNGGAGALGTLYQNQSGNEAFNNIFYNSTPLSFRLFPTHDYNYFNNSGGSQGEANAQIASDNPFVDIARGDFHLIAPTIAGKTLPAPFNVDPDLATRGASGIWQRGAYDGIGGAAQPTPPLPPTNLVTTVQ